MKIPSLISVFFLMVLQPVVMAQDDTAHHRAIYSEINEKQASFKQVESTHKDEPLILKPEASVEKVLKSPKTYKGKKCRVQWKSSTEKIPEAGGDMKVEQILSVEWLK